MGGMGGKSYRAGFQKLRLDLETSVVDISKGPDTRSQSGITDCDHRLGSQTGIVYIFTISVITYFDPRLGLKCYEIFEKRIHDTSLCDQRQIRDLGLLPIHCAPNISRRGRSPFSRSPLALPHIFGSSKGSDIRGSTRWS